MALAPSSPSGVTMPSVLSAIAQCESGAKQFNADGTVVFNATSSDYGFFQINKQWLPLTEKMGLDIKYSARDNIEFGIWLYGQDGTKDWSASKACWDK